MAARAQPVYVLKGLLITSRRYEEVDLPAPSAYLLESRIPTREWPTPLRPPSHSHPANGTSKIRWYRNINLFSIAYAFRPRLRDRLTLSRLALLRKPWAYGVPVSHRHYRYSCQHGHFCSVHLSFRSSFSLNRTLPYHHVRRIIRNPQLR